MNKTIFITGATSGFGEACAKLFAVNNNKLIVIEVMPVCQACGPFSINRDD